MQAASVYLQRAYDGGFPRRGRAKNADAEANLQRLPQLQHFGDQGRQRLVATLQEHRMYCSLKGLVCLQTAQHQPPAI